MNAPLDHSRLKPRPLYEEVAELLRQRIFASKSGDLEPGAWIDELKIAEEYGISRTPLREAIKVLAAEGLVTMKMRRGAYVTEVNAKDLSDVFHLMAVLESDAAATVAKNATTDQLKELETLHQQLEKSTKDRVKFFSINEAFHLKLFEIANNRWAGQIVADLRKVMKLNRAQSLLKTGRIEESLSEHASIMVALRKRDAQAAQAAMRVHISSGLEAAA
ncbi:MAG: GntR family transcriptional regulator [Burkholderiales bacterium]|nr:MAG: GntR family transcriptional regulator [Burkholderiales bacterium]